MKYPSETAMQIQHFEDAVDTVGGVYDDVVNAVFGTLLHVIVRGNQGDMTKVAEDIKTLCDHYVNRCAIVQAANVSPDRTLN